MADSEYDMTDLLTLVTVEGAEGLCLIVGEQPVVHLGGEPHLIDGPLITPENARTLLRGVATTRQTRELLTRGMVEFVYTFQDTTQFKVLAKTQLDRLHLELWRWAV